MSVKLLRWADLGQVSLYAVYPFTKRRRTGYGEDQHSQNYFHLDHFSGLYPLNLRDYAILSLMRRVHIFHIEGIP